MMIANQAPATFRLFDALDAIKQEHPEIEGILEQFHIDQDEYDRAMLALLSSQLGLGFTCANEKTLR